MKKTLITLILLVILLITACSPTSNDTDITPNSDIEITITTGITPKEAFEGYRSAIEEQDFDKYKQYIHLEGLDEIEAQIGEELTEETFVEATALIAGLFTSVEDVIIEDEIVTGDKIIWKVLDANDPGATGTITFVKEGDDWKLAAEEWTTSSEL